MMVKVKQALAVAVVAMAAAGLSACGGFGGGAAPSSGSAVMSPAAAPVPFAEAKFAFAPVTGAPASVLNRMSAQLAKEATVQRVTLVPSGDPAATYVVKGYLSAVGDVSGTILVYVWDVLDTSGRRVHRISGQETTAGGSQLDPWSGVDGSTTNDLARRTISAIVAWGTTSG